MIQIGSMTKRPNVQLQRAVVGKNYNLNFNITDTNFYYLKTMRWLCLLVFLGKAFSLCSQSGSRKRVGETTHISSREGGEKLEFFKGVSLGGHKVEENLELTAAQETPFQKLAARCADSQLADLLS